MKTPQVTPDWKTGIYIGNGQRTLMTDGGEYALMDVREIRLDPRADA